jgi:hypothetical protein
MGQHALHCASGFLGRRSFMRSAACAGLCAAAPLNWLTGPAKAANWRGLVGCVKPRANDSALVDMIRLLPVGIGVAPVYLNFAEATREEFQTIAALGRPRRGARSPARPSPRAPLRPGRSKSSLFAGDLSRLAPVRASGTARLVGRSN